MIARAFISAVMIGVVSLVIGSVLFYKSKSEKMKYIGTLIRTIGGVVTLIMVVACAFARISLISADQHR